MGSTPVSLTVNNGVLYVLDAGGTGNIAGFWVSPSGHLTFISGSVRPLSNLGMGAAASPEEIGFSPDGQHLLVTEKGSNNIDVYNVRDGLATGPIVVTSSGLAPYGFGFTPRGIAVVSEAANSAASSYNVTRSGLNVISASIIDTQAAACWLVVSANGKYAYAANAGSGTISGFQVSKTGQLTLLTANGITGNTGVGSHPIDMAFGGDGQFLYVLASGNNMINAFTVHPDGSLSFIASYSSSSGASGLAGQ